MQAEKRDFLDGLAVTCASQLFSYYGVEASTSAPTEAPAPIAGIVGLVGDALLGTVVLATCEGVLRATSGGTPTTDIDWVGELANQLAGRLKNELLRWGIAVNLSTPVTLTGGSHIAAVQHASTTAFELETSAGPIRMWLKAEEVAPFAFVERVVESVVDEGELVLF